MNSKLTGPRPRATDYAVRRRAAEMLMPEIIRWLGAEWSAASAADRESYVDDLVSAVTVCGDGYKMARDVERHGWSPDAELVEILDCEILLSAEWLAVAEWVKENGMTKMKRVAMTKTPEPTAEGGTTAGSASNADSPEPGSATLIASTAMWTDPARVNADAQIASVKVCVTIMELIARVSITKEVACEWANLCAALRTLEAARQWGADVAVRGLTVAQAGGATSSAIELYRAITGEEP